jgi:hypothetical protein
MQYCLETARKPWRGAPVSRAGSCLTAINNAHNSGAALTMTAWYSPPLPGSTRAVKPNVLCQRDLGPWQRRPGRYGVTVTEDPGRRGGTGQTRAPRNRDPREAEWGPRVMSRLDTSRSSRPRAGTAPTAGNSPAVAKPIAARDRRSAGKCA